MTTQEDLQKIEKHFQRESQRQNVQNIFDYTTQKIDKPPNKEMENTIKDVSPTKKTLFDAFDKQYRNCKTQIKTKWDIFQPYAFCKLSQLEQSNVFHDLFDDFMRLKKIYNETDDKLNMQKTQNKALEEEIGRVRLKKGIKPSERIKKQNQQVTQNAQLREEVKRLHQKIVALTGNKYKLRPQSSAKNNQKTIFPANQNIKAELQLERKQVRQLLLSIDELKKIKMSLQNQLRQKQQNQNYSNASRAPRNKRGKEEGDDQLFTFQISKLKQKYSDLQVCYNKMSEDKDRRIKGLELQNLELKENQRFKNTKSNNNYASVNVNLLEQKIYELQREKQSLESEVRRLVSLPFNQSGDNKSQIELQNKCSKLQLAITKMKDDLVKTKQSNSKYLAQLQYKNKQNIMLKTDNDKFKKQVKQLMQRQNNLKEDSLAIDYDDYYRRLLGIVKLEGDDPCWLKYANLATPSFNIMDTTQLKSQCQQLWKSKLQLLAHLQRAQVQMKTFKESSQSRLGLYLKDKDQLQEELRVVRARLDQKMSMEKIGVRREVQLYGWGGVKYDDSISVFDADELEIKQIEPTQNYFDLFIGQLNLDQATLLHNPHNKIKQINQIVSFLTIDFFNHDTQHSHFVEGNSRKIDNNFSFKVQMNQSIIKYLSKQSVTLQLWSPQGSSTVLLGKGEIWLRDLVLNATKDVSVVIKGKCPFYQPDRSLVATLQYRIRMRLPIGSFCEWNRNQQKQGRSAIDMMRLNQKKRLQIKVIQAINLPSNSSSFVYFTFQGQDFFTQAIKGSSPEWNYRKQLQLMVGQELEEELKQNYLQFTVFDDDKPVNDDIFGVAKADLTKLIDQVQQLDLELDIKDKDFEKVGKLKVQFKWL